MKSNLKSKLSNSIGNLKRVEAKLSLVFVGNIGAEPREIRTANQAILYPEFSTRTLLRARENHLHNDV